MARLDRTSAQVINHSAGSKISNLRGESPSEKSSTFTRSEKLSFSNNCGQNQSNISKTPTGETSIFSGKSMKKNQKTDVVVNSEVFNNVYEIKYLLEKISHIIEHQNGLANNYEGYQDAMGKCQLFLADLIRNSKSFSQIIPNPNPKLNPTKTSSWENFVGGGFGKSGDGGLARLRDINEKIFNKNPTEVSFRDDCARGNTMSHKVKEVMKRVQDAQVENEGLMKEAKKYLNGGAIF